MPRETYRTLTVHLALDALARLRAQAHVPEVQEAYHRHEERTYGARGEADVSSAYVLMGAVTIGLNRWTLRFADLPKASVFRPVAGEAVELVAVPVIEADLARAAKLAETLDVEVALVLGAAACSGLAVLAGDDVTLGPFEVPRGA